MRAFVLLLFLLIPSFQATAAAISCDSVLLPAGKLSVNQNLAAKAGLNYVTNRQVGYSRQVVKQDGVFEQKPVYTISYYDSDGKVISDPEILNRIRSLGIPPSWQNVWISSDPLAHIQATGTDVRGRTQYKYHSVWNSEVRDASKFSRMFRFGQQIPKLHSAISSDLEKPVSDVNCRIAAVVRLMEIAGIRIGGKEYAEENEHYGLSSLEAQHVLHTDDSGVRFAFVGKEGKFHEIDIQDPQIIRVVRELILGKSRTDLLFDVSESSINEYIKSNSASEFSAKDIRTWVGTTLAAKYLIENGPAPKNPAQLRSIELGAASLASDRLGNEPGTARKYYINPIVFEAFRSGRLQELSLSMSKEVIARGRPIEEIVVLRLTGP